MAPHAGEAVAARAHPDPDAVAHHFREAGDARAYDLARSGPAIGRSAPTPTSSRAIASRRRSCCVEIERCNRLRSGDGCCGASPGCAGYSDPRRGVAYLDEAMVCARQVGDQLLSATCSLTVDAPQ